MTYKSVDHSAIAFSAVRKTALAAVVMSTLAANTLFAAEASTASRAIAILLARCAECHGESEREGGLKLTDRVDAMALTDSGKLAIVPGELEQSELWQRITTADKDRQMPPDEHPLTPQEIDVLKTWILDGAKWPENAPRKQVHWAYKVPRRPARPIVRNRAWPHNDIDYFILAELESRGLSPSPPADRRQLLRRVYLDLIGLPPSIDQQNEFLSDRSEAAFEKVVDQLLSSDHFGEKWARAWLDAARYSDSNGYQADQIREMWAFRDWVIDALNDDMPFDRFTIEQIAGDLLPNATVEQRIATGFHRATTCNVEAGVDPEGNRTDQIIDRVNTTATVWLGTTLECAQCHNHKYDPFTQEDYYGVFAFFNNTQIEVTKDNDNPNNVQFSFWGPKLELPLPPRKQERRIELSKIRKRLNAERAQRRKLVMQRFTDWNHVEQELDNKQRESLPKQIRNILDIAPAKRSEKSKTQLVDWLVEQDSAIQRLTKEINEVQKELNTLKPPSTLVMVEMDAPRETNILIRGDFLQKGPNVTPDVPDALHPFPSDAPRNRLGFAQWLVSRKNPLVARVTVNRWWAELFGNGVVRTIEDFGAQGERPSHPELLDWLAVELMDNGWSMKHILKTIVMSATYQQSSRITPTLLQVDPQNRWLARGPRFRLPAELIRDNALAIGGILSESRYGPPVYPPQPPGLWNQTGRNEPIYEIDRDERRYRRGIYVVWRRAAPYPSFINFDAPDRMSCVVKRPITNTPMQALTLLNDEAFVEAAKGLAYRIAIHPTDSLDERIDLAFRLTLCRHPKPDELDLLREFYSDEYSRIAESPQTAADIIGSYPVQRKLKRVPDLCEWSAWFCVANALLNLDETITKN